MLSGDGRPELTASARRGLDSSDRVVLAVAVAVLAWLFYRQLMAGSLVVDGTRYFLLDDDMMVSMRYGRNLAEGQGLVWNTGERVEGYTNFLWTLVMAGVHLFPIGDAHTALVMKVISFALVAGTLYLALRLLRVFVGSRLAAPLLMLGLLTCVDVVHWAAWGFEVALLGFLELVFLVCLLEGRRMPVGWIALALIPLVRSDALHLFAADAALALLLARPAWRPVAARCLVALVPFALHLLFRRAYYGDWVPNTYHLRLGLLDDRYERGAVYVGRFLLQYAVVLAAAVAAAIAIARTDRRAIALFVVVGASLAYVVTTGGDSLVNFRFLGHVMPLVLVFAVAGVVMVSRGGIGPVVVAAVLFLVGVPPGRPLSSLLAPDKNGDPYEQLPVAMLINKNADLDSRVAVIAAGIVPYFTHRPAIDVLGKNDRHVARLRPLPGSQIAHGKLDPAHSLRSGPDLVVSYRSRAVVDSVPSGLRTNDPVLRLLAAPVFQRDYRPHPIEEEFLLGRTAVFTRRGSPENEDRRWEGVEVSP